MKKDRIALSYLNNTRLLFSQNRIIKKIAFKAPMVQFIILGLINH